MSRRASADSLSGPAARRILLAAQGFGAPRPSGPVTMRHLTETVRRLGFFQIDSVNVAQRAHLMPLFSRRGGYDPRLLRRAAEERPRRVFEYWAHVATYVDVELFPAMRHRMKDGHGMWKRIGRMAEQPELLDRVLAAVAERGPATARQIETELHGSVSRDRSHWGWNWSAAKTALEYLFFTGEITSAARTDSFERLYDLTERVIPPEILRRPELDRAEAHRSLIEHAARALGVATEPCLRDYFRTAVAPTRAAVAELVEEGTLRPVRIDGWDRQAYLHRRARRPRRIDARALLSPFDPVVFERTRTERIFDFRYRIEIYVPEARREYGYYVLPFLLGDQLAARVDLRADRSGGVLEVRGAWAETETPPHAAAALADELREFAEWLGLSDVRVERRGDLADALATTLGPS